jgi:hypothetical protein
MNIESLIHNICNVNRESLIRNILNADNLEENVVISAVQSLYHVAEKGDEKYLLQLLKNKNLRIVAWALEMLHVNFHLDNEIKEHVFLYASQYASLYPLCEQEEREELQMYALIILQSMAFTDKEALRILIEIAEDYKWIPNVSAAASANAFAWELLAKIYGLKVKGEENIELVWNVHSSKSELIRCKIRKIKYDIF